MTRLILLSIVIATMSCNLLTDSTSEPVVIKVPESKSSNFETNDSSFLKVKIKGEGFEVDFLEKTSTIENVTGLDSFLGKNIAFLDKEKIVVTGMDTTEKSKAFRDVLKKYGVSRFRLNDE